MEFGALSKELFSRNHPYPEFALARAKYAHANIDQDGFGLTKIPERVLQRYSDLPRDQWFTINDSQIVEAAVLAEVDEKALVELGFNESMQHHHVDSPAIDRDYIAQIRSTRRRKYVDTQATEIYDVDLEYQGILELVDEVYLKHGIEPDRSDHLRLRNKIIAFMQRER